MTSTARRSLRRQPQTCGSQLPARPDAHPDCRPSSPRQETWRSPRIRQSHHRSHRLRKKTLAPDNKRLGIPCTSLTGVVHVEVTAPAGADVSKSLEHDGKRLQTACRCHLKLPVTCYMIQRQSPLSPILCKTSACHAAIPTEQDPVTSTVNSDDSDHA